MEGKELNKDFFAGEKDNFVKCMMKEFSEYNLSNMERNAQNIKFSEYDSIQAPAKYIGECNEIAYSIKNIENYEFSEDELRYMVFHELIHMSSTKTVGKILSIPKTGWGAGSAFFQKRFAITEGMTDYLAEVAAGKRFDIGYFFEKRCAESICEIFGHDAIQSFLNADTKELIEHAKSLGVDKKEILQLFDKMDKSLIWRYKYTKEEPKEKNAQIYQIEKELIDILIKTSIIKGDTNEQIASKISKIQSRFIPGEQKEEYISKEEEFLSKHSENLSKAFEYAERQKNKFLSMQKSDETIRDDSQNEHFKESLKDKIKTIQEQDKDNDNIKKKINLEERDILLRDD